jgi:hypothetical protein
MAMPDRDDITRLRPEPVEATLARLEEAVGGLREDVSEIKAGQQAFVAHMDHRVTYIEDVRLTGLENREIRRQAVAEERKRQADESAKHAQQAAQDAQLAVVEAQTRQLKITWKSATAVGILVAAATIIGDVLSHVHL